MVESSNQSAKQECSLVILGHSNVGKSSFCGRLLVDMEMVTNRQIDQYKAKAHQKGLDSWWLAYVLDSDDFEQSKGTTVEVGRKTIETASRKYNIADCPGHQKYAINMINSVLMADFAVVIVSAKKNEFEAGFKIDNEEASEGSTRQHFKMLKASNCKKIIVAVNKMDDNSVEWAQDIFEARVQYIKDFTSKLFRDVDVNDLLTFVPTSAIQGQNVVKSSNCWYKGRSVLETLDSFQAPYVDSFQTPYENQLQMSQMKQSDLVRIVIQDPVESTTSQGMYIAKVQSGHVQLNQELFYFPQTLKTQITSIFDMEMNPIEKAFAGQLVYIQMNKFEVEDSKCQGVILTRSSTPPCVSSQLEVQIQTYQLPQGEKTMIHLVVDAEVNLHIHGLQIPCKITRIKEVINQNGKQTKNNIIRSLNRAVCILTFQRHIAFENEKHLLARPFAHFLLRSDNTTIAVGKILRHKPDAPKIIINALQ